MAPASSRRGPKPRTRSKPAPGKRKRVDTRPRGSSEFFGLSKLQGRSRNGHFLAQQIAQGRHYRAGIWIDEHDAALAVDRMRLYLSLDPVNFPDVAVAAGPASPEELTQRASEQYHQSLEQGCRFKGVIPGASSSRWRAVVRVDGKMVSLGLYERDDDAALARDRGALYFNRAAELNIPGAGTEPESPERLRAWSERLRSHPNQYTGVEKDPESGRWRARAIVPRGKSFRILDVGTWDMRIEAARARDRAVLHYVGDRADLNLPKERRKLTPATSKILRQEARLQVRRSMSKARTWREGSHQYVSYKGKAMTLAGWAAELGISRQAICIRAASGCSIETVVSRPPPERVELRKLYRHQGRSLTLSKWARKLGVPYTILHSRVVVLGWPLAKAVSTPVRACSTNKYRGIQKRGSGWVARIIHEGSKIDLGRHRSAVEAARAYDRAARKLKGPRWTLNFPDRASGHPKR